MMRSLLALMLMAFSLSMGPWAAEPGPDGLLERLAEEQPRDKVIRKALTFLRSRTTANGQVGTEVPTASTSLALMAHFAAGHPPGDAEFGRWIATGLDRVLAQQNGNGYFGEADQSRMYGHGITTLMLAEALGMSQDEDLEERIRSALDRAIALTVSASQVEKPAELAGGWRYSPGEKSSDLSLSGWQLMSLHAARQVGMEVPASVIDGAVAFAKRLIGADGRVGYSAPGEDKPALRGLALLCLAIGDDLDAPEAARVVDRILNDPIDWRGPWFFYRCYYESVGLSRAVPTVWAGYGPTLERVLIEHQAEDGSWPTPPGDNEGGNGVVYRTSMAVLALTVNKHLLPAYQR